MSTPKDREALIWCPRPCKGFAEEKDVIEVLHGLCEAHGYGAVEQLVKQLAMLKEKPDFLEIAKAQKKEHFKWMRECQEVADPQNAHLYDEKYL